MKKCFAILRGHESDVLPDDWQPFVWRTVPLLRSSFCLSVTPSQSIEPELRGCERSWRERRNSFPRAGGHPGKAF
jgi:hypothetical protein